MFKEFGSLNTVSPFTIARFGACEGTCLSCGDKYTAIGRSLVTDTCDACMIVLIADLYLKLHPEDTFKIRLFKNSFACFVESFALGDYLQEVSL